LKSLLPCNWLLPFAKTHQTKPIIPKCQHCGTDMVKTILKGKSDYSLQLLGVILFIIGSFSLLAFPIGTIIGILVIILSARLGRKSKNKKIWRCQNCQYFFEISS